LRSLTPSGINGGPIPDGRISDFAATDQVGDDFTLSVMQTANQIQWWGFYAGGNTPTTPDAFTIRFFTITAGVPAVVPLFDYFVGDVGRVDSGLNAGSSDIYSFTTTIPDTLLPAGSYLLSIVNNTAADTDDDWWWAFSGHLPQAARERNNDGQPWGNLLRETAFNISGPSAVPETGSSILLLAFALIGLLAVHRRWAV
jgi:hypothetical protein